MYSEEGTTKHGARRGLSRLSQAGICGGATIYDMLVCIAEDSAILGLLTLKRGFSKDGRDSM